MPKEEDDILHDDRPCPKYDQLYQYYSEKSPEVRAVYAEYGHLFPYWAQMSGVKIYSLESVSVLYKKLLTNAGQNKPLVLWLTFLSRLLTFLNVFPLLMQHTRLGEE